MNLEELEYRIKIKLPQDKLQEILYHSSYPSQDPNLAKRNKGYITWGHAIGEAAFSLYLYLLDINMTVGELNCTIARTYRSIEASIFTNYNLEEFVQKGNGELNNLHPDIVPKLFVLIYQQYGFIRLYDFLLPWFKASDIITNIDYKTLLQEYAQAEKLFPVYEVIDTSGPEHKKKYICKVTVGTMTSIGEGLSKKNAEKEAAKELMLQYKIPLNKKEIKNIKKQKKYFLTDTRKTKLNAALKIMRLNNQYISYRQLDEALTHVSYVNTHPNEACHSNANISIVGDRILTMLCSEYILEKYDIALISIETVRNMLLKKENLSKSIFDTIDELILTGNSIKPDNKEAIISLRIDVFKSVIGMMWKNYVTKNDTAIADFVKLYVYKILGANAKEKNPDYRTLLQNVTQSFGWSFTNEYNIKSYYGNTVYISNITVKGTDWEEKGSGAGSTKVSAANSASKDILLDLVSRCAENKTIENEILRILDPELFFEYITKKNIASVNKQNATPSDRKVIVIKAESRDEVPLEVSFDGSEHILYICKGTVYCRKNGHEIVSSTGILASLDGKRIRININYCKSCKIFFIGLTEYKYYQDLYGILLGHISIQETFGDKGKGYSSLSNESILHICGYSVNQSDNLSTEERRLILGNLMDREIISKHRIMEYLQFFINNSKYRSDMRIAHKKWSEDLEWVRYYNINKQRKYIITSLKRWR